MTVYCILSDGEVVSDTVHVPISQHSNVLPFYFPPQSVLYHLVRHIGDCRRAGFPQVSLEWSSDRAQPGEQVSLTVSGLEPHSQFGIVVMGMDSELPHTDLDLTVEEVKTTQQCFLTVICVRGLSINSVSVC